MVALSATTLTSMVLAPPRVMGADAVTGLWPTSFKAQQTAVDCGKWKLDSNGFCVADDARNGLEIGVRFQTSQEVQIIGVRIYRFDTAALTGSLWDASGTLLAHGDFAPGPAHAWQDMTFATPVTIEPGTTYVASYFSPNTRYAFRYDYFADSGRTVGPITALGGPDGHPDGVFCYKSAACTFPVRGYRSSSYWVTPLWAGGSTTSSSGPRMSSVTPPRVVRVRPGSQPARPTATVQITFSKAMWPSTLTPSTVRLLHRSKPIATRLSYLPAQHRLVLTPRSKLRAGSRYRVEVTTRVRDSQGHRLDQDAHMAGLQRGIWTLRTR